MHFKNWLLGTVFLICAIASKAQQPHFIYLQSEKFAPFFVKISGKHLSSTAAGYLILPKLSADSSYHFTLGLAGSSEMQDYVLAVNGKDAGYMIKNYGDKGWGLENIQTGVVQMSHEVSSKLEYEEAEKLKQQEKARQDSIAREAAEYAGLDSVKKEEVSAVVAADTLKPAATEAAKQETEKKDTLAAEKKSDNNADQAAKVVAGAGAAAGAAVVVADGKPAKKDEPKFLDMEMGGDSAAAKSGEAVTAKAADSAKAVVNSTLVNDTLKAAPADTLKAAPIPATDSITTQPPVADTMKTVADEPAAAKSRVPCVAMATREDAEKLLAMPATTTDDLAKLTEAYNKLFAQKCVYTSQLTKFAKMLPTDTARYQLFEAAWAHTIDYFNFAELRSTLSDPALIAKFNKLLQ